MDSLLLFWIPSEQNLSDALVPDEPQTVPAGSTNLLAIHGQL